MRRRSIDFLTSRSQKRSPPSCKRKAGSRKSIGSRGDRRSPDPLSFEYHRQITRPVASLIAQRSPADVLSERAAHHVEMACAAFRVPGFEVVVAHVEEPAMLAFLEPFFSEPVETFARRHDVLRRLGKIESVRQSAAGDEKCSAAEFPHCFADGLAEPPMRLAWSPPPDRARHQRDAPLAAK